MKIKHEKVKWPKARVEAARKNLRTILLNGKTLPAPGILHEKIQGLPILKSTKTGPSRVLRDLRMGYSLFVLMTAADVLKQHVMALRKSMNLKRTDGEALTAIMRAVEHMPRETPLQARRADRSAAVSGMQIAHLINRNIPISGIVKFASTPGQSPIAWYCAERLRRAEESRKRSGATPRKKKVANRTVSSLAIGRKKKDRVLAELELCGSGRFRVVRSCLLPTLSKVRSRNERWRRISGSAKK